MIFYLGSAPEHESFETIIPITFPFKNSFISFFPNRPPHDERDWFPVVRDVVARTSFNPFSPKVDVCWCVPLKMKEVLQKSPHALSNVAMKKNMINEFFTFQTNFASASEIKSFIFQFLDVKTPPLIASQ